MYMKRLYNYHDELRDNIEASLQCPTLAQLLGTSLSQPLWWNLGKNTRQPAKLYRQRRRPFQRENYSINDLMHPVPLNWRHSQPVVQTPRYYKPTTLKKRPSRLCLPVACKLDPIYRTSCSRKKPSSCDVSTLDKDWQRDLNIGKKHSLRRSTSVELEAVSSDLDSLLVKYETMFDSRNNPNSWTTPKPPVHTDASIARPLPLPRIPTTIRDRQMRRLPSSSPNSMCNQSEPADKGESPGESTHLEGMLNDLVNKGFLPSITEEQTRSLQDMYSQLHEENTEKKQREDSVELRNSKSFIVSLIDNAVSRELSSTNTTQDSKTADGYEEFVHLDVGDAIDIVKSESSHKLNTQLCMDITRALTDKLINTTSKNSFLRAPEEPAYVKQLKQLRWDHLKHIQREVQRLEELERFLDSCSSNHSLYASSSFPK